MAIRFNFNQCENNSNHETQNKLNLFLQRIYQKVFDKNKINSNQKRPQLFPRLSSNRSSDDINYSTFNFDKLGNTRKLNPTSSTTQNTVSRIDSDVFQNSVPPLPSILQRKSSKSANSPKLYPHLLSVRFSSKSSRSSMSNDRGCLRNSLLSPNLSDTKLLSTVPNIYTSKKSDSENDETSSECSESDDSDNSEDLNEDLLFGDSSSYEIWYKDVPEINEENVIPLKSVLKVKSDYDYPSISINDSVEIQLKSMKLKALKTQIKSSTCDSPKSILERPVEKCISCCLCCKSKQKQSYSDDIAENNCIEAEQRSLSTEDVIVYHELLDDIISPLFEVSDKSSKPLEKI